MCNTRNIPLMVWDIAWDFRYNLSGGNMGCQMANLSASPSVNWRTGITLVLNPLFLGLTLFIPAGRLDWLAAWIYIMVQTLTLVISRIVVWRVHPDLLVERSHAFDRRDEKRWDRPLVMLVALVGPLVMAIVAGLDMRYDWSSGISALAQVIALIVLVAGYALGSWAMAVNRFYSATVRIQTDRGHRVVSNGPYAFVRHPSYIGGAIAYLALPLLLGSWWALIPSVLTTAVLILRTALEDRTLLAELHGYAEYAQRVRYRLVPGVW